MLRRTQLSRINHYAAVKRRVSHREHQYREITKWQRTAMGLTDWQHKQSHLKHSSTKFRFNPNYAGLTKGVSAEEAKQWIHHDQMKLPMQKDEGFVDPKPHGRRAWPAAWTEDFADRILALTDAELGEFVMETLTQVIFEETQRDGYELRRLDMEGNPMTEHPTEEVIANFNLEEPTLRDRVIERAIEEPFGFAPDSTQRAKIRSVPDVVEYVVARITVCRVEKRVVVTDAVLDFLADQPIQPEFGYQHALPQDTRADLVKAWEAEFHYPWQFGNAAYTPRVREEDQLTPAFMAAESKIAAREQFEQDLDSGELRRRHLEKLQQAAAQ